MRANTTPLGERVQIGFFGKTNAGKSSLINAVANQQVAIVSSKKGTTTDPVKKSMELLPLGPVVLIDTPGMDDTGILGKQRIKKTEQMLRQSDIVVVVTAYGQDDVDDLEKELIQKARKQNRDCLVVVNKADLAKKEYDFAEEKNALGREWGIEAEDICFVSTFTGAGISQFKEKLRHRRIYETDRPLVRDLICPGETVILVVPLDAAAPKGRLILPQQQTIRDILEGGGIPVVVRDEEYEKVFLVLRKKPALVITDSQVFQKIAEKTPKEIPLTSFSILMARYKGDLKTQIEGAKSLDTLQDGDKVLISEGCTHHRQCGDIGSEKIPTWITSYCQKDLIFSFTSGAEFPENLAEYSLIVHCGGCMLPVQEMRYRILRGAEDKIAITNYGVLIAYIHGILDRVTAPFCQKDEIPVESLS